jgi:hypothetical protein
MLGALAWQYSRITRLWFSKTARKPSFFTYGSDLVMLFSLALPLISFPPGMPTFFGMEFSFRPLLIVPVIVVLTAVTEQIEFPRNPYITLVDELQPLSNEVDANA